jgi:hypothetical protein
MLEHQTSKRILKKAQKDLSLGLFPCSKGILTEWNRNKKVKAQKRNEIVTLLANCCWQ